MILYSIQHHGKWEALCWLLTQLQHPQSQFLIKYDGAESEVEKIRFWISANRIKAKRIIVQQSFPVYWCGPSQALALVASMKAALDFSDWDVWINLSGRCVPIKSQNFIYKKISEIFDGGVDACISYFPVKRPYEIPNLSIGEVEDYAEFGRLKILATKELNEKFSRSDYFPVRNAANRPFLRCEEINSPQRVLRVWRPDNAEIEFRKIYFIKYRHFCGRAWYFISRSAVKKIVDFFESSASEEWRAVFFNSFQPDESFLQTAILSHNVLSADRVINDNYRFNQGSPMELSLANIKKVLESEALFARKLPITGHDKILERLEGAVLE